MKETNYIFYLQNKSILLLIVSGKDNTRLNGAWHDEGRIADTLAEDSLWNTLGKLNLSE